MKLKLNNKYVKFGFTIFCVVVASLLFYYVLFHGMAASNLIRRFFRILTPIMIGLILAYLLTPVLNVIEQRIVTPVFKKITFKRPSKKHFWIRAVSVTITFFLFFTLLYMLISMFVSQIVPSITNLVANFDVYIDNVTKQLNKLLEDNPTVGNYIIRLINQYSGELEEWLNDTVLSKGSHLIKVVSVSVINIVKIFLDILIGLVISIYTLAGKERFAGQSKKVIYGLFETKSANIILQNFRSVHKVFIGFFGGKVIDSFIIGLLCFAGTSILQTPYAALVSLIIGVTNIVPFFGPVIGLVPTAALVFLVDPAHPLNMLYFVIFVLVLQQFDGNILGPKILGDSTGLSSFWVLFSITLFGGAFGVFGMIIGVPFFAVFYSGFKSFINIKLENKNLPVDTRRYITVDSVDETGKFKELQD